MRLHSRKIVEYVSLHRENGWRDALVYDLNFLLDVMMYVFNQYGKAEAKSFYECVFSEKMRSDYKLLLEIVNEFGFVDIDFVSELVDEGFNLNGDVVDKNKENERLVLLDRLCNLMENGTRGKYFLEFSSMLDIAYNFLRYYVRMNKSKYDDASQKIIQRGFYFVKEFCGDNEELLEIMSKKFVEEFFSGDVISESDHSGINLELLLHLDFNSVDALRKTNLNGYLIGLIRRYDSNFSDYLLIHIKLLDGIKKKIDVFLDRWDLYREPDELKKYYMIFRRVHWYVLANRDTCFLSETELLYLAAVDLGVEDKIVYFGNLDRVLISRIMYSYCGADDRINLESNNRHVEMVKCFIRGILFDSGKNVIVYKPSKVIS